MSTRIPFEWARRQALGAVKQGISLERLLSDSMITLKYGDTRDTIDSTQFLLLSLNTVIGIEDAGHGLARSTMGVFYPAIGARMASTYPSLEDAIQALARLYSSACPALSIRLSTSHASATLSVHADSADEQDAIMLEEMQLGWMFMQCVQFLGGRLPALQVTVRDPAHFNLGQSHWAMAARVHLDTTTSFSFPRALLAAAPARSVGRELFWDSHRIWFDMINGADARRRCPIT